MSHRRYQLQVYNRGVTATTGTVAFTLTSSQFYKAPTVGGQSVRASEGRVESQPWILDVVDNNATFTGQLADSSGRMHLLGRLVRFRTALDSTASTSYTNLAVGRLTDVALGPEVATYRLTINDERWVERQTQIFVNANTCMLIPSGLISGFHRTPATPPALWDVKVVTGNVVCLQYRSILGGASDSYAVVVRRALETIISDVKPSALGGSATVTSGSFNTVRFRRTTTSTDYEIVTFDSVVSNGNLVGPGQTIVNALQGANTPIHSRLVVWLYWPSSQPSAGTSVTGYVYAPTHAPSPDLPFHIGGVDGIRPWALTEQIYQGTYSGTTSLPVRYSTAALASLKNDPSYGRCWVRVTSPISMSEFLEDRIYGPYSVIPVGDSSGKLAPISLRLPHSSGITPGSLLTLGSSNLTTPHPTWEHPSGEVINALRLSHEQYTDDIPDQLSEATLLQLYLTGNVDAIQASTQTIERTHDSVVNLGRRERTFTLPGTVHKAATGTASTGVPLPNVDELADQLAANVFPRFGDGPIFSDVNALQMVDATTRGRLLPGAFVILSLQTMPQPASLTRGQSPSTGRVMQIIERRDRPDGPSFRLLDIGPNAVLNAPTITLAQSTRTPRHAVVVTIGSIPSNARWEAQLAVTSTGTTAKPVTSSTKWFPVKATSRGTASTTFTRGQLPSNSKIWGRVRAFRAQRIGSLWSTASPSTKTAAIIAPTITGVSAISAGTAVLKWTYGSSQYGSVIMVDASTAAVLGSSNTVARVGAGTTYYQLVGLNSNDSHKVGVRHYDLFGGVSAQDTTTFTTTTGFTQAPALKGLTILEGA